MSRWFQRLFGRTDAFALSLAFDRDPHPGAGLTPAVERSYGGRRCRVYCITWLNKGNRTVVMQQPRSFPNIAYTHRISP